MSKKFYPSTPKNKTNSNTMFNVINSFSIKNIKDLQPLPCVDNKDSLNLFNSYKQRIFDNWVNYEANVGIGNSLMQYSEFFTRRLSYQECASLATDDIINSAINTIANECINQWGVINNTENELAKYLDRRLRELDFKNVLKQGVVKSLIFGGVGLFINIGGEQELNKVLIESKEVLSRNKIINIRVLEPWTFAPYVVNTLNPIDSDYMKPKEWYVMGASTSVNSTRLYTMSFFEAPDLLKPMFNFLGLSLCSFMKDKVRSADTIRQSLSDLFLRFKTDIIKTPAMQQTNEEAVRKRIQLLNMSKNNLGTLLLAENEEWIQTIATLAGLDKIQAQAYESIASSARMPAIKLLGLTPSGFNATGAFDLENYYDTISGYQNTIIKHFIEKVLRLLSLEAGHDVYPEFEFNPLQKDDKLEKAQTNNLNADFVSKIIDSGIVTQEQGLDILQKLQSIDKDIKFDDSNSEDDLDIDLDFNNEQ